jgi:hypothetical protein
MLEHLEMKKRKLRDDHDNFDLNAGNFSSYNRKDTIYDAKAVGTRKAARLGPKVEDSRMGFSSRKKPKEKGAVLNFLLKDVEVNDDLSMIRKVS